MIEQKFYKNGNFYNIIQVPKVQNLKKCFDGSLEEMLNVVIVTALKSDNPVSHNFVTTKSLKTIFFLYRLEPP